MPRILPADGRTRSLKNLIAASCAILGLATVILPSAAEAAAILIDQGGTTYDQTSGLDWLDLTATDGMSTQDVLANAGVSYIADGWRYASFSEVLGLYEHAGITLDPTDAQTYIGLTIGGLDNAMYGLLTLLGETGGDNHMEGFFKDTPGDNTGWAYIGITSPYGDGTLRNDALVRDHYADAVTQSSVAGSFLVRSHVSDVTVTPLPAALPMFAAATGLMGLMGWRRKKNNAA